MINLFIILLSILSNHGINQDLNIIKNDYTNLVYFYNHPYLIKNESDFIKNLENLKYIDKKSEPVFLKLLITNYKHNNKIKKLKKINKKYNIIHDFIIYKYPKIELFEELPIDYIKTHYKENFLEKNKINNLLDNFYILETYCKFNHNHSAYLYNDLTDLSYINDKKLKGNSFILKNNKDKNYFKFSLKYYGNNKKENLIYIKGANCDLKYQNNYKNKEIIVKKFKNKVIIKNEEITLPSDKDEIMDLIKENSDMSNYKLYNFYLLNDLPNEAYKYLIKWSNKCYNYYSNKEKQIFYKEYIPAYYKNTIKAPKTLIDLNKHQFLNYNEKAIKNIKENINLTKNEILKKEIFIKKENNRYYQYIHYLISVKNASRFIDYFKISSDVDILGVYSIIDNKKTPLETKFTESEIFLKEIENNMILEIYLKSRTDKIIFIPEKYFSIKNFKISFDKKISYKLINSNDYNLINNKQTNNIKAYFKIPMEANILDFLPYYILDKEIKAPNELKWYYFYKNLSHLKIPNSLNKINDIKKAYYYFQNKNKPLVFYNWSKLKKINTKLLIFHLKNDIYGNKLFNYPIIQYKNNYLDLNINDLGFGKLPLYLKNKEYIEIDEKGRYLYKHNEKILKKFVKNNIVKINYKILEDLDYAEFEINITLNDHYSSGLRSMLKKYKDEEILAKILELYINTKIKNTSLIDYEIKENKENINIYIKGITKNPLDYFEVENKEFLKIKNYFSELFTPFFNQTPKLTEYIYTSKILNPIEIKTSYQEDFELNIELLDKDYKFTGDNPKKIQIKDSFYLPSDIISTQKYKKFHKTISSITSKKRNMLDDIFIVKKEPKGEK